MDVVTFSYKNLPDTTKESVQILARKLRDLPNKQPTVLHHWFDDMGYNDIVITPAYGDKYPETLWIMDYRITMPKDKYVEFCLTWL